MTDKVQKIREKVVEIVNSINPFIPDEDGKNSDYEAGRLDEAIQILQVIDSLQEEPVSEDFEKIVEEIAEPTILNAYGTKELARRLCNTICDTSVSEDLEEVAKNMLDAYKPIFSSSTSEGEPIEYYSPEQMRTMFMKGIYWQKENYPKELTNSDLETAADKYAIKMYNMFIKDETTLNNKEGDEILSDAFKAGANWQKQLMMKNAVECDVIRKDDGLADLRWKDENGLKKLTSNLNNGDKVKIITVKKENKV